MKFVPLAVATALSLGVAPAFAADKDPEPGKMQPSMSLEGLLDRDAKAFVETAASANQFEVEASQLALLRATDPALKAFAQRMVRDHEKAGRELQALARKKGLIVPASLLKRHEAMLKDLRDGKQGKGFDDRYRDQMIASHQEAVSLFDEQAKEGRDPDLKAFAAKTLPTLQDHGGAAKALPKPG